MRPEDDILNHLELQIPEMAEGAFTKAYWDALSSGQSVLVLEGGHLVEVHPDGSKEIRKKAPPSVEVTTRHFFIP